MSENSSTQAGQPGLTIVVYTPWTIATGVVHPRGIARLSDAFNNWDDAFIPLEDAHFVDLATDQVEPQLRGTLLLPLPEILLLHEVLSGAVLSQHGGDEEMHVQKRALRVQAQAGPYRVEGTLYLPPYSTLASYLNRSEEAFLALTSAVIALPAGERRLEVRVPFVLVCRGCILINEAQAGGTVG
jgi:hypothetical protein